MIRLTYTLLDAWMDSYPREPASVTLDIDDTCDVVHGHQQLSLFNAYYDERCFLPIHVYDTGRSTPVAVILRPGRTPGGIELENRRPCRRDREPHPPCVRRGMPRGRSLSAAWLARCSRSVRNRPGLRPITNPIPSNAYKTGLVQNTVKTPDDHPRSLPASRHSSKMTVLSSIDRARKSVPTEITRTRTPNVSFIHLIIAPHLRRPPYAAADQKAPHLLADLLESRSSSRAVCGNVLAHAISFPCPYLETLEARENWLIVLSR